MDCFFLLYKELISSNGQFLYHLDVSNCKYVKLVPSLTSSVSVLLVCF